MSIIKSYSEVIALPTFYERFQYLKLKGQVGEQTFGRDRHINQTLYMSPEWKRFRRDIILRDLGCDLACEGFDVIGKIVIHHINPLTFEDVVNRAASIFDPENVISTSFQTHNAIHYGSENVLGADPIERKPNDTCPWKR